jgi:aminoglycoside phosphotransferase family enzyme/predicted kinase
MKGEPTRGPRENEIRFDQLACREGFPEDPSAVYGVHEVQTHISHVFLTADRVYKFRKAVDLGFVCFATRAERNADCLREVSLNRRLVADVYLGVAPLFTDVDPPRVGPATEALVVDEMDGAPLEHCVVMRRLPDGRDALTLLEKGELTNEYIARAAKCIARFHRAHRLDAEARLSKDAWRERWSEPIEANFESLGQSRVVDSSLLDAVRRRTQAFVADHGDWLERRRLEGRAVDGHGDLHLQHLWFEGDERDPRIIDCVEFCESLRQIDAASDVAFLAMDLRYRCAPSLAEHFLRIYARECDDFSLYSVVDFYAGYRAAVRAKVAAIVAEAEEVDESQRAAAAVSANRHLELAASLLECRPPGALIAVGGIIGTGKSRVASALAEEIDGVVVSSDRLRKHLAGIPPTGRIAGAWNDGLYAPAMTERVYEGLLERAVAIVASGRVAILDATFALRSQREAVRRAAADARACSFFVHTRCDPAIVRGRLKRRMAEGRDPSDAGPALYRLSATRFEEPVEWPNSARFDVRTEGEWLGDVRAIAERVRRSAA